MKQKRYDVELSGSPSYSSFLNDMVKNGKKLTNLEYHNNAIWFRTDRSGLRFVRAHRRRYKLKVHIVRLEDSTPFERLFYSWRLLLFCIVPFLASFLLWDVTIEAEHPEIAEHVEKALKQSSVQPLQFLKKIPDESSLRTIIMANEPHLSWVRFERKGTTLTVIPMLSPRTEEKPQQDKSPGELAARTGGVITGFQLSSGEPVVHRNQTVKKNDLLASGVLEQGDKTAVVGAEGAVFADYWLEYQFTLPTTVQYRSAGEQKIMIDWHLPWEKNRESGRPLWKVFEVKSYTEQAIKQATLKKGMEETFILPLLKHKLLSESSFEKEIKDENILHLTFDNDKVTGTVLFLINENIAVKRPISQGGDN